MGRHGRPWLRSDRNLWYATIGGKQVCLGADKDEAQREWHRQSSVTAPERLTSRSVPVLCQLYLDAARPRVSPYTYKLYRHTLQRWADTYARVRPDELRAHHIRRWLAGQPTWGQSTRSSRASIVKRWGAWIAAEGYVDDDRLHTFRCEGSIKRGAAPEGALEQILTATEGTEFGDFLTILYDTGARPGEIRTLEATQIDFRASVAHVRGKTGQRMIGLTADALAILKRNAIRHPDGPVLRQRNGKPWNVVAIWRRWRSTTESLAIVGVVPYSYRHSYWSRATRAGIDSVTIARQLGHVDLRQLVGRYAHADARMLAAAAQQVQSGAPPAKRRSRSGGT